jgi:hypothetical protein
VIHLPTRKLRGDHCHCRTCGEYFNSTKAFDKHRVSDGCMAGTRRCRMAPQMLQSGMDRDEGGWWITSKRPDSAPRYDSGSGAGKKAISEAREGVAFGNDGANP